ncbi:MAG: type II secretion system protein [bacterium]
MRRLSDERARHAFAFPAGRAAWTLIELLVALAICALIATSALMLWTTASRAFSKQRMSGERDQTAYAALRALGDDLRAVAIPPRGAGVALTLDRPVSAGITAVVSRILLPVVSPDQRDDTQERLTLMHVQYEVRRGTDGAAVLWRTTRDYGAAPSDSDPATALFSLVAAFDIQISTNGRSWTNAVTLRPGSACPPAVRLRLAWLTGANATQTVNSTVAIPAGQSYAAPAATRNRNPPRRR